MKLFINNAVYHLTIHQNRKNLPYILFFHGFMGTGYVFRPLLPQLMEACNPITIDLLGHGQTTAEPISERFTVQSQLNDMQSILDRLQLKNLFLYGYSMGGRLAQHLFLSNPPGFSGLFLESTNCGILDAADRKKRIQTDEEYAEEIEHEFPKFLDKWINLPLFQSPECSTRFNYEEILRGQKPELMAASLRGFGTGSMQPVCDQLSNIHAPLALIAGKSDQKYVDKMLEMAQLCTNAELKIIDGAGHRVHADQPYQTANFITKFLHIHG